MVQFECPRHSSPSVSLTYGAGLFPFINTCMLNDFAAVNFTRNLNVMSLMSQSFKIVPSVAILLL